MKHHSRKLITWDVEEAPRYPGLTPCWNCTSHKPGHFGYPIIHSHHRNQHVSRFIYEECFGLNNSKNEVRHRCDNVQCINPEHLIEGTHADNMRDTAIRGTRIGERSNHAKLTLKQVMEIDRLCKISGHVVKGIAKKFHVTLSAIHRIKHGKSWVKAIQQTL